MRSDQQKCKSKNRSMKVNMTGYISELWQLFFTPLPPQIGYNKLLEEWYSTSKGETFSKWDSEQETGFLFRQNKPIGVLIGHPMNKFPPHTQYTDLIRCECGSFAVSVVIMYAACWLNKENIHTKKYPVLIFYLGGTRN